MRFVITALIRNSIALGIPKRVSISVSWYKLPSQGARGIDGDLTANDSATDQGILGTSPSKDDG